MPELPEVETVVSDLNKKIKGDIVTGFWSDWPSAIKNVTFQKFKKEIVGRKILRARRIGKNIFIDLSGGKTLYVHLKMTGHLLIKPQSKSQKSENDKHDYFSDKVNKYIHHVWQLSRGKKMEFSDVRKFAKMVWVDTEKINELPEIKKLGVDAMSPQFTLIKFKSILSKKKNKPIGIVLMEQELIAGIGNIYRSEILFEAGIFPQRKVATLNEEEIKKIYQWTKKVLQKAIKMRGTSDSDYRDTSGAPGSFQRVLRVYRKAGKKCKQCDTIVKRFVMGQRSVFFCPHCQK